MADPVRETTPLLEWGVGLLGLIMVLGTVGFLIYKGLESEAPYPDVEVRVVDIQAQRNGYLVAFEARNRGGETAQGVLVRGRLQTPNGVETSEVRLDYVPAGSVRNGGLFFRDDPRGRPLAVHAEGYMQP